MIGTPVRSQKYYRQAKLLKKAMEKHQLKELNCSFFRQVYLQDTHHLSGDWGLRFGPDSAAKMPELSKGWDVKNNYGRSPLLILQKND